jgi:hypothetical protein
MGGIEAQMKKQNTLNYYDLLLNQETGRYVFRLLAFKTVISNPNQYGFHFTKRESRIIIPVVKHKIDSSIVNLSSFATQLGYNYEILKAFNPWLLKNSLTNPDRKTYIITLPKKGFNLGNVLELDKNEDRQNITTIDSLFKSEDDSTNIRNRLRVTLIFAKDDELSEIAKKYNVSVGDIRTWNKWEETKIPDVGTKFIIYLPSK